MKLAMLLAIALVIIPCAYAFDTGSVIIYSQPLALPPSLLSGALLAVVSCPLFPGVIGWIFGFSFLVPLQTIFDLRAHAEGISLWEIAIDVVHAFCYAGIIELCGGFVIGMMLGQMIGVILCLPVLLLLSILRPLL
jgi:hypothetical protein